MHSSLNSKIIYLSLKYPTSPPRWGRLRRTSNSISALRDVFSHPNLKSLSIFEFSPQQHGEEQWFLDVLQHSSNIEFLDLCGSEFKFTRSTECPLPFEGIGVLKYRFLTKLQLSWTTLRGGELIQFLGNNKACLRTLGLSRITLSSGRWEPIFDDMTTMPELLSFYFDMLMESNCKPNPNQVHHHMRHVGYVACVESGAKSVLRTRAFIEYLRSQHLMKVYDTAHFGLVRFPSYGDFLAAERRSQFT